MITQDGTNSSLERRARLQASRLERFRRMVEIRLVEDRIIALFGDGLIPGSTHTCQGQEAVSVAVAAALRPSDTVACTYRGHGMALALGVTREALLGEIFGRRIGCMGGLGGSMHLSDPTVGLLPTFAIVGAGVPIGVGAALAAQVKGTSDISVSVFGDGASNIGAFHEGLNLAAVWSLPTVFVCENNLYGEYSPIARTTPVTDIAVRAASYKMPSQVVDGQDLDALEEVVGAAAARARQGGGPTLIEAKTYRYAGHSRSDKATYRPDGELEEWLRRDPITLFGRRLVEEGAADEDALEAVWEESRGHLEQSLETVLASPVPGPADMLANVTAGRS
jgi:TPP-dependent pyruvate/acetoin dehydrogenase alpha subunit